MSRTDKTKPFHIKLAHRDLAWEEVHNHDEGPCDLAPESDLGSYGWSAVTRRRCYRSFVYTGTHTCCCSLCHSSDEYETRPQKKRRMQGRRECRNWEREYDESWDDRRMWVDNGGYAGAWNVESWFDWAVDDDDRMNIRMWDWERATRSL